MSVRVKSGGADRYVQNASNAGQSYIDGINNPRQDWVTATANGEKNYNAAVQAAIAQGRFGKAVKKAGNAAWQNGAINKGAARYPAGVALAKDKYEAAMAPYLQTIQSLTLPARGQKGDAGNYTRVKVIGDALHSKKLSMKG